MPGKIKRKHKDEAIFIIPVTRSQSKRQYYSQESWRNTGHADSNSNSEETSLVRRMGTATEQHNDVIEKRTLPNSSTACFGGPNNIKSACDHYSSPPNGRTNAAIEQKTTWNGKTGNLSKGKSAKRKTVRSNPFLRIPLRSHVRQNVFPLPRIPNFDVPHMGQDCDSQHSLGSAHEMPPPSSPPPSPTSSPANSLGTSSSCLRQKQVQHHHNEKSDDVLRFHSPINFNTAPNNSLMNSQQSPSTSQSVQEPLYCNEGPNEMPTNCGEFTTVRKESVFKSCEQQKATIHPNDSANILPNFKFAADASAGDRPYQRFEDFQSTTKPKTPEEPRIAPFVMGNNQLLIGYFYPLDLEGFVKQLMSSATTLEKQK